MAGVIYNQTQYFTCPRNSAPGTITYYGPNGIVANTGEVIYELPFGAANGYFVQLQDSGSLVIMDLNANVLNTLSPSDAIVTGSCGVGFRCSQGIVIKAPVLPFLLYLNDQGTLSLFNNAKLSITPIWTNKFASNSLVNPVI